MYVYLLVKILYSILFIEPKFEASKITPFLKTFTFKVLRISWN